MAHQKRPTLASIVGKSSAPPKSTAGLPSLQEVLGQGGSKLPSVKDLVSGKNLPSASAPSHHHHGGIGHWLLSKTEKAASDLKNTPGGIVHTAAALEKDQLDALKKGDIVDATPIGALLYGKRTRKVEKSTVESTKETVEHPLRDPFQTALLASAALSGGASIASRAAAAGRALDEGAGVGAALKAGAKRPGVKPRFLEKNGEQVPIQASKNPAVRAVQGAHDKLVQRSMDRHPEGRVAAYGSKRIAGSLAETGRYQARMREVPANLLDQAARRITSKRPGALKSRLHQAALELTSVNTGPEEAAAYHAAQAEKLSARADELMAKKTLNGREAAELKDATQSARRNQIISRLYKRVHERGLLTKNDHGDVVVSADHPKLAEADVRLARVQGRGDEILRRYGVRSADQLAERVNAPGRIRAGATYEKPTPGKAGQSPALDRAVRLRDRLQQRFDEMQGKQRGRMVEAPMNLAEAKSEYGRLKLEHDKAVEKMAGEMFGPVDRREVNFRNRENARAARQEAGSSNAHGYTDSKGVFHQQSRRRSPASCRTRGARSSARRSRRSRSRRSPGRASRRGSSRRHHRDGRPLHFHQIIRFVNTSERRAQAIRTGSARSHVEPRRARPHPRRRAREDPAAVNEILGKSKLTTDDIDGLQRRARRRSRPTWCPACSDRFAPTAAQGIGTRRPTGTPGSTGTCSATSRSPGRAARPDRPLRRQRQLRCDRRDRLLQDRPRRHPLS
jgi:hypothetical protein